MTRLLFALLTLCFMSVSMAADDAKQLTAILLVARAEMPDPNFKDSVVLVTNQAGRAPVGVIINRPTRIPVSRLFPELEYLAQLDDKLYFGGPVATDKLSFLFRAVEPREGAMEVFGGVYFSTSRELLLELLGRDKPLEGLRLFMGHSSWAPGQLEGEVSRNDWTLAPANSSAIFESRPERLWRELHREGGGQRASLDRPTFSLQGHIDACSSLALQAASLAAEGI